MGCRPETHLGLVRVVPSKLTEGKSGQGMKVRVTQGDSQAPGVLESYSEA